MTPSHPTAPSSLPVRQTEGSRLYLQYVLPDESFDRINDRVWSGTPWITDAYTGRYSRDPSSRREREMLEWCHNTFGPEAWPFSNNPRFGRWRRGGATVMGWTWFGFSTEAEMQQFEAEWPPPNPINPEEAS